MNKSCCDLCQTSGTVGEIAVPTLAGGFSGKSVGYAVMGLPQLVFLELIHFKLNTSVITVSGMAIQHWDTHTGGGIFKS